MKVIAYDPFLSEERASGLGVEKVELDELLARADFITLHTPLTDKTSNIIDAAAIAKMKKGVRIINCARGGLIVEEDLIAALKSGKVAAPRSTCSRSSRRPTSPLFGLENVVATPHLGASTTEAQENVALQVAEQMSDYLVTGAVSNALNMPSITAEEAPRLRPFVKLAEMLGSFAGQLTEDPIKEIEIEFDGSTAAMNTKALIGAALAGLIRPQVADVNMVSAPIMAKERGIMLTEVKRDKSGVYDGYIRLTVTTEKQTRSIAGTAFPTASRASSRSRASTSRPSSASTCSTSPTTTSRASSAGSARCSATRRQHRQLQPRPRRPGGDAIALLYLDAPFPEDVLAQIRAHKSIQSAKKLQFDVGAA